MIVNCLQKQLQDFPSRDTLQIYDQFIQYKKNIKIITFHILVTKKISHKYFKLYDF